jgi:A/G-specific adenine glycosylase
MGAAPRAFAARVIAWQTTHGRHHLPWQNTEDGYRIWLSEIMLQQTQVAAVIPYFERFLRAFPTVHALARAPIEDVLAQWAGLGYYARARNLHAAAKTLVRDFDGVFPNDPDVIASLPGIGRSTANAIAAFAHGARAPILDGNVKRVLARHAGIEGYPGVRAVEMQLWDEATQRVAPKASHADMRAYTQGMMDLGAQVCKKNAPLCLLCPVNADCIAHHSQRVDEIPAARPSKVLPHRTKFVVTIFDAEHIYLQRRPDQGIWGGLLSLPEFDTEAAASAWLKSEIPAAQFERDAPIEHAFTHYRLTLHPLRVRLRKRTTITGLEAIARATIAREGLPAPIKKYLLVMR